MGQIQYMEFLTQYLGTKGFVELMKQLRLDDHINIKEINYHHNQIIIIILNYEKVYISHQQTQFKSELIILQG